MQYILNPDVVLQPADDEQWVAINLRIDTRVLIDAGVLKVLQDFKQGALADAWQTRFIDLHGKDITSFRQAQGLMHYSDNVQANAVLEVTGKTLYELLCKHCILNQQDLKDYEEYLKPKTSLMDKSHRGTFHQCVGQHLFLQLREREHWRWWHEQKFAPDGLQVKDGYYKWIEEDCFKKYFSAQELRRKKVLDFACGNGYFSNLFTTYGAEVVGIDTSALLIDMAKKNYADKIEWVNPKDPAACHNYLKSAPAASFDVIYISDALLFFFFDLQATEQQDSSLPQLLNAFHRLLKVGGALYIMEPNAVFWLSPRLGMATRPLAITSEYRQQMYQVSPTADKVIQAVNAQGFTLKNFMHPEICAAAAGINEAAHAYAKNYPLWDFYHFLKS